MKIIINSLISGFTVTLTHDNGSIDAYARTTEKETSELVNTLLCNVHILTEPETIEFTIGEIVQTADGGKRGIVDDVLPYAQYPIRVKWDKNTIDSAPLGDNDSFTTAGSYYDQATTDSKGASIRSEWNIVKV